ncbi:hypothetical protein FF80_04131 [Devosia sp. LC5]|uniref:hypothetical protein n=1 Tax=Devosia sp. LC5 TaxID=1502724 RepID=UPI0004E2945D|nr:hypothetical protein [Devosia sp. LC5]KFC61340.1 hypothetical protein FF80_04131 [Devosia sp. LC5]
MSETMIQRRSMAREFGTALAVLALYLLTILAPLHQVRASQLDFARLGYETTTTGWVLCTANDTSGDNDVTIAKCPAAGIGKNDLVLPTLASIDLGASIVAAVPTGITQQAKILLPRQTAPGGPRAPPVQL